MVKDGYARRAQSSAVSRRCGVAGGRCPGRSRGFARSRERRGLDSGGTRTDSESGFRAAGAQRPGLTASNPPGQVSCFRGPAACGHGHLLGGTHGGAERNWPGARQENRRQPGFPGRVRLDRRVGAGPRDRAGAIREARAAGDVFPGAASSKCGRRPASRTAAGARENSSRPRFSLTRFPQATTFRTRSNSRRKAFLTSFHGCTRSC